MKTINKMAGMRIGVFLVGALFLISLVSGFSVSMPYMENKQLKIFPGEIKDLEFVLQNGGGATEDVNAKARIIEGSEIIEITDPNDIYLVEAGGMTKANFKITVPSYAKIGDVYHVELGFSTETAGGGGFGFGSEVVQTFDVIVGEEVVEKEETETGLGNALVYGIIIAILILVIIIFFVTRKRKIQSN